MPQYVQRPRFRRRCSLLGSLPEKRRTVFSTMHVTLREHCGQVCPFKACAHCLQAHTYARRLETTRFLHACMCMHADDSAYARSRLVKVKVCRGRSKQKAFCSRS